MHRSAAVEGGVFAVVMDCQPGRQALCSRLRARRYRRCTPGRLLPFIGVVRRCSWMSSTTVCWWACVVLSQGVLPWAFGSAPAWRCLAGYDCRQACQVCRCVILQYWWQLSQPIQLHAFHLVPSAVYTSYLLEVVRLTGTDTGCADLKHRTMQLIVRYLAWCHGIVWQCQWQLAV